MFEGSQFTVCEAGDGKIELIAASATEQPIRRLADIESSLGGRAARVAFAMNAGMYDQDGRPIGLAIVEGKQKHAINRRKGGGNFHLMPNGVFQIRRDRTAQIVTSDKWTPSPAVRIATQSGPMLVINGRIHPKISDQGVSRKVRNGVGVRDGRTVVFAISNGPVTFGEFARLFRDELGCPNALFLDGSISSLYAPSISRRDGFWPVGPILAASRRT
ncbi:MAG: phosphodiester glycosidase family protein [Sphingomicrobium sp.]